MRTRTAPLAAALAASVSLGCFSTNWGGNERYLVFATGTKFGLDFTQRADQNVDVTMGYDRVEIASIPTALEGTATPTEDVYSVLGSFCVRYASPWSDDSAFQLRQVFATGEAAVKVARLDRIRQHFQDVMAGDAALCKGSGPDQEAAADAPGDEQ